MQLPVRFWPIFTLRERRLRVESDRPTTAAFNPKCTRQEQHLRLPAGNSPCKASQTIQLQAHPQSSLGRGRVSCSPATLTDEMMALDALTSLVDYVPVLSPILALFTAWFWITPCSLMGLRLTIGLIAFILTRDMMTPRGFSPGLQWPQPPSSKRVLVGKRFHRPRSLSLSYFCFFLLERRWVFW